MPAPADLRKVVEDWIARSGPVSSKRAHRPSNSRLAKHCLTPVVFELVSPTPIVTYAERVCLLLDSAEAALAADLDAASAEVAQIALGIVAAGRVTRIGDLLPSSAVQERLAAALRRDLLHAWLGCLDSDGEPIRPIARAWVGAHHELADKLAETADLRRCRAWAKQVKADEGPVFARAWRAEVAAAIGDSNAQAHRPAATEVGLGELTQPPITGTPEQRYEWRAATDRSFHDRIELYWHSAHIPRDIQDANPPGELPQDRFVKAEDPGIALVSESVNRTVAPLGLFEPAHRTLAGLLAEAVQVAADDPGKAWSTEAPWVSDAWQWLLDDPTNPQAVVAVGQAITKYLGGRLVDSGIFGGDIDAGEYGKCVARRVWVRLHAWEVVASRITGRALVHDLRLAGTKSLLAAGISGPPQEVSKGQRRLANTLAILAEITDSGVRDPRAVVAQYAKLHRTRSKDPAIRARGGLYSQAELRRLLESNEDES